MSEWNQIKTQEDTAELDEHFEGFHDSCIKEAVLKTRHHVNSDLSMTVDGELDTSMRFLVQRQFKNPSVIEMQFEGVTKLNFVPTASNYDSIIYGATVGFENGQVFWALEHSGPPSILDAERDTWITAISLKWREADEYLGDRDIYGGAT